MLRALIYTHCVLVAWLTNFALWGVRHYEVQEFWRFRLLAEKVFPLSSYNLLSASCCLFPLAAAYTACFCGKGAWKWLAVLADFALAFAQLLALALICPFRD